MHNKASHRMHIWTSSLSNCKQMRLYCIHCNSVHMLCFGFFPQKSLFLLYITSVIYLPIQGSVDLLTLLKQLVIRACPSVSQLLSCSFIPDSLYIHYRFPERFLSLILHSFKICFTQAQHCFLHYCPLYGLSSVVQTWGYSDCIVRTFQLQAYLSCLHYF